MMNDTIWNAGGRYLAFAGADHYPAGGFNDFVGRFASKEAALKALLKKANDGMADWWHIVDHSTGKIIDKSEKKN